MNTESDSSKKEPNPSETPPDTESLKPPQSPKSNNPGKSQTPGKNGGGDDRFTVRMEPQKPIGRSPWGWISLVALVSLLAMLFWNGRGDSRKEIELSYSPDFKMVCSAGLVEKISIDNSEKPTAKGKIKLPKETDAGISQTLELLRTKYGVGAPDGTPFRVNIGNGALVGETLASSGNSIEVVYERNSNLLTLFFINLFPTLLLVAVIWLVFVRSMRGGASAMEFGKSRAHLRDPNANKVRFKDVAGCDETKEEVIEVVDFLKDPSRFSRLGGKMPHGILLCGPPGTGKTLIAKAIAGEADVPFFSISGSDFVEMFVGVGASRVRDMFAEAKKSQPCLIFIDEIDAVGRRRGTGIGGGHDEREQTLNSLLVEMDGFESNQGIVVIAATNRPDVLDPALLRPGRFDRQLVVDLPTLEGRLQILQVHTQKICLAEGTDLSVIARGTPGCSGADLANIVNEAALIASRQDKPAVDLDDLEEARDKILWGKERRSHVIDDEQQKLTAYHEAGHAILSVLEPDADPLHKITIIPRGMALGLTAFLPKKDRVSLSRKHLLAQLVVSMGGRVAEELFLPDICTGARQDIKQATQIAHSMVCEWGMSEKLGPRAFGKNEELVFLGREVNRTQDYSDRTAERIDDEVDAILRNAYERAHRQLSEHREAVELLVKELLARETVSGEDAVDIVRYGRIRTSAERGEAPPPAPPPAPDAPVAADPASPPAETPSASPAEPEEPKTSEA
ncbi:MAG: ATP-dependent zinc metalloprotease FtsH [Kiritimatiellia bacterium]